MNLVVFIATLFPKRKSNSSFYHEAVSEGIKDALKEMEYQPDDDGKVKIDGDEVLSPYCIN